LTDRRKVCVVVASRANLARVTTVLEAVRDHPTLELQVIAAASALLERFGSAVNVLEDAGFKPDAKIRPPARFDSLVGRRLRRPVGSDEPLCEDDLETSPVSGSG